MDKMRHVRFYSFRARMQAALTLSAVIAGIVSLLCAYAYSHYNMRLDMMDTQYNAAINMLDLEQKTNLSINEIVSMMETDDVKIQIMSEAELPLTEPDRHRLLTRTVLSLAGGGATMPVTYVMLKNATVRISADYRRSTFITAFWRVAVLGLSTSTLFILFSIFSAWRIAKPVSQLTRATKQVSEGDFSVQLPEDQEDEIGALMCSFNRMTDALQRTSWLQKDFIASVSHEFRTPIASIKGYARLLQMPELDDEKRAEYVNMIAQESDRLSRLSETLLRLTALEQQTAPASLSSFRLDEQVRQVILRMEPVWSAREIALELNLDPVTIESDSELLTQVWINLIQNAVKFSAQGGVVEITVRRTDQAEFEITDHGVGMSEETLGRIFDRFYQADTSRSKEGVGLGLCLVQRILDILQGEIKVRSKLGEGTTIRVRMPLTPSPKRKEDYHGNGT